MVINWTITRLDADSQTNAVFNVHICITGTDGTNTADKNFVVGLQHTPEDTFVPYEDLTEELVLGWVKTKLGSDVERFEAEVENMVLNKAEPAASVNLGLPW